MYNGFVESAESVETRKQHILRPGRASAAERTEKLIERLEAIDRKLAPILNMKADAQPECKCGGMLFVLESGDSYCLNCGEEQ